MPIDSYAIPRFIAILAVVLGAIWYVAAWSDQQPFKLLGAAGIIVFLINPFEMTKPLNAFERVMIAIGIGFALYVSITLGWLVIQEWRKAAPKPIYAMAEASDARALTAYSDEAGRNETGIGGRLRRNTHLEAAARPLVPPNLPEKMASIR